MIAHPSVGNLLAEHGNTASGRPKARAALLDAMLAVARHEAQTAGRSMVCRVDNHARCRSDGSTCICECHDMVDAKEGSAA